MARCSNQDAGGLRSLSTSKKSLNYRWVKETTELNRTEYGQTKAIHDMTNQREEKAGRGNSHHRWQRRWQQSEVTQQAKLGIEPNLQEIPVQFLAPAS